MRTRPRLAPWLPTTASTASGPAGVTATGPSSYSSKIVPIGPSFSVSPIASAAVTLLAAIAATESVSTEPDDTASMANPSRPTTMAAVTPSTFSSASRMPRSPPTATSAVCTSTPPSGSLKRWNVGALEGLSAIGILSFQHFNAATFQRPGWLGHAGVEDRGNFRHEAAELQPGLADVSPGVDDDPHIVVLAGHRQEDDVPFSDQHDVVNGAAIQFLTHVVEHFAGHGAFFRNLLHGEIRIDLQRFDGRAVHPAYQRPQQVFYVPSHFNTSCVETLER